MSEPLMEVFVNGKPLRCREGISLAELLLRPEFAGKPIAVALNTEFVQRALYGCTLLRPKDAVEILTPMQGG